MKAYASDAWPLGLAIVRKIRPTKLRFRNWVLLPSSDEKERIENVSVSPLVELASNVV
jgi:hypothetical protein